MTTDPDFSFRQALIESKLGDASNIIGLTEAQILEVERAQGVVLPQI